MAIDWEEVVDVAEDSGKEVLSLLKPYLPALSRSGKDVYEGFIKHLLDADWASIDQLMFEHMNDAEREELDQEIYKDAYAATLQKYKNKELLKQILTKVVIRIAIKAATAGIV